MDHSLLKKKLKSLWVFKNLEGSVFKYGVNIYHIQSQLVLRKQVSYMQLRFNCGVPEQRLLVDTYPMRYRHIYEICEQLLAVDILCRQLAISVRFRKHLLADIHYKHSYCFMVMNDKVQNENS